MAKTRRPSASSTNDTRPADGPKREPRKDTDEPLESTPAWLLLGALASFATVILVAYGVIVHSTSLLVIEVLLGVTGLSVGGFFGFLFGMPRSPTETTDGYKPSTNLEQVSDWLTKILIGAGLVQLGSLRDSLAGIGTLVATSHEPVPTGASLVSQLVVILYLIIGFLASFLWTRIYYGPIQALADRDLIARLKSLEETKKVVNLIAKGELVTGSGTRAGAPAAAQSAPISRVDALSDSPGGESLQDGRQSDWSGVVTDDPDVARLVAEFEKEPVNWNDDPNARLFRGAPREKNGRRLRGEIVATLDDALIIRVRIERIEGEPLEGDVLFLLHPTFPERIVFVPDKGGVFETAFYAAGTFTVVAIADRGKTVLALNLNDLPGIPDWFRDR